MLWRGLGIDYEGGVLDHPARVAIHFAHRLGAMRRGARAAASRRCARCAARRDARACGGAGACSACCSRAARPRRSWCCAPCRWRSPPRTTPAPRCCCWPRCALNRAAQPGGMFADQIAARIAPTPRGPRVFRPPAEPPSLQLTPRWRDYYELTKPRVVMLIVFTAIVGMFLAVPGLPPLRRAGVRHARHRARGRQRRGDQPRARPAHRRADGAHAATGRCRRARCRARQALVFAGVLGVAVDGDPRAAGQPADRGAHVRLADRLRGVYTVWLKRATPQNIVIGGAAGAAPPVLGWAAVTGHASIRTRCCCS